MRQIQENISRLEKELEGYNCQLVAVSKTKPNEMIMEAYDGGHRHFGENKVQDLVEKYESLPKDIHWHMIGHLQRNKVKYIAPFVHLIHGVDTVKLLKEINKEGRKNDRIIDVLLQVHIAQESTKFGFDIEELKELLTTQLLDELSNVQIVGLMGMATNSPDKDLIRHEFSSLKRHFNSLDSQISHPRLTLKEISMGMSGDYKIAAEEGSTMVRIGSTIFGARIYNPDKKL